MYVFTEKLQLKAGTQEKAKEAVNRLIKSTREEDGCLFAGFYSDTIDPTVYLVFEEWETKEAWQIHMGNLPADVSAVMKECIAGPFPIELHEVAKTENLG